MKKRAGKKGGNRMKKRKVIGESGFISLLNYSFIKQLIKTYFVPNADDKMGEGTVSSLRNPGPCPVRDALFPLNNQPFQPD